MDGSGIGVQFSTGAWDFLLCTTSRPFVGLTLPPLQLVPGALSPGVKWQRQEANHSPSVPRLRMFGDIPPFTHPSSWHGI
jgi:hypothetical protein